MCLAKGQAHCARWIPLNRQSMIITPGKILHLTPEEFWVVLRLPAAVFEFRTWLSSNPYSCASIETHATHVVDGGCESQQWMDQ